MEDIVFFKWAINGLFFIACVHIALTCQKGQNFEPLRLANGLALNKQHNY